MPQEYTELEKIDLLRNRADLSYSEAKKFLDEADGDVVQALVLIEREGKQRYERIYSKGSELLDRIKELIRQGNVNKIRVKTKENVVLEIPVTAGVVGAMIAPSLAIIGAVAALATNCSIEVERGKPEGGSAEPGNKDETNEPSPEEWH